MFYWTCNIISKLKYLMIKERTSLESHARTRSRGDVWGVSGFCNIKSVKGKDNRDTILEFSKPYIFCPCVCKQKVRGFYVPGLQRLVPARSTGYRWSRNVYSTVLNKTFNSLLSSYCHVQI